MSYLPQAGYPVQGGEPPLDHPWYGIGFLDAVKRVFKKYATFTGRASRGEYWWWILFVSVVGIVLYGLALGITFGTMTSNGQLSPAAIPLFVVLGVFYLAIIVPTIAVAVRRLHDAGYSGWFYLLNLIPSVGSIIMIVLCVMQTSPLAPKYGPPVPEGWQEGNPAGYQQIGYAQAGYAQPGYDQQAGYPQQGYPQQGYPQQPPVQGGYVQQPPVQGGYVQQPPVQGGYYGDGGSDQPPGSANPPRN